MRFNSQSKGLIHQVVYTEVDKYYFFPERLRIAEIMDFSVGSKLLRPDAECSISAIQAALEKVVFVNISIYYLLGKIFFFLKDRLS